LICLALVAMLVLVALPAQRAEAASSNPLFVKVEGPSLVSISEKHQYIITSVGGPAEAGGNYSFTAYLKSEQLSFDGFVVPTSGVSTSGTFVITVTAPTTPQLMDLVVNVTSNKGLDTTSASARLLITTVNSIVISADVVNQGTMAVSGVPVIFSVDGNVIYSTSINLTAGEMRSVVYNWTGSASQGEHVLTVQLDPNGQFVRFASGGTIYTQTIFIGSGGFDNINLLMVMIFILLLLAAFFMYKRPAKKRKKKT
jgi:hypothetical protein